MDMVKYQLFEYCPQCHWDNMEFDDIEFFIEDWQIHARDSVCPNCGIWLIHEIEDEEGNMISTYKCNIQWWEQE